MIRRTGLAALLALAIVQAAPATAQGVPAPADAFAGTRLDVVATGQVIRVPDIVRVSAGVATQAPTAGEALRQNAALMARARAALARAGIAERDVQTQSLQLSAIYRSGDYQRQEVTGYRASNTIIVRFRDVGSAGRVLDALVAEGVNELQGPMLGFDDVEAARDEARTAAIASARARAELYARALGMRVKRVAYVTEAQPDRFESGGVFNVAGPATDTLIDPGGRSIGARVTVTFELE